MKILILFENSNIYEEQNIVFLRHAEEWSKQDNEIYILGNYSTSKKLSSSLNFIEKPIYLLNNLMISIWLSVVNHPDFDLVIKDLSLIPFFYKKSELVYYLAERTNPKNSISKILGRTWEIAFSYLIKHFYIKSRFLVSGWNQFNFLTKSNVEKQRILMLDVGLETKSKIKSRNSRRFNKNIAYVENDSNPNSYSDAINVFKEIERRDEGWKYLLIIKKDHFQKAKDLLKDSEISIESYTLLPFIHSNLRSKLASVGLLLDVDANNTSLSIDLDAMVLSIPVITYKSEYINSITGFEKSVLLSEKKDFGYLARIAMNYAKNPEMNVKMKQSIESFISLYSWKKLAEKSFKFLESI